jgi:hypothetical protein
MLFDDSVGKADCVGSFVELEHLQRLATIIPTSPQGQSSIGLTDGKSDDRVPHVCMTSLWTIDVFCAISSIEISLS